jgi:hypothetical protein
MRLVVVMVRCRGVFGDLMLVPVIVIDVPVRVPVHDAVGMAVGVRMRVVGFAGVWPFRHDARFGPNVGKAP